MVSSDCSERSEERRVVFYLESNDDVSDQSDDEGSGSGFTSGSCFSSCFELSLDRVSRFLSSQVAIFIGSVR